jgi:DNA-binding SARP family transcriptional activator
MEGSDLTIRVLGPVQIVLSSGIVELPSASQRRLLAALAVHAPQSVRLDWLCWVLGVSSSAVRTTVTRLRRVAGDDLVHTTVTGYRLSAAVDATLACAELEAAEGDPELIRQALGRWVGRPLEEFRDEAWAAGEAARLDEVYASAVEDRAEALVAHRQADQAIAILEPHLHTHPFRDHPQGLLVRALAAVGRRTEALRRYQAYRRFLADEVGTEPSDELRRIEQRVAAGWDGVETHHQSEGVTDRSRPPSAQRTLAMPTALVARREIVGRRSELAVLAGAASAAQHSGLQVVLVNGEAGIGKTSLVSAFVRDHCPLPWRIVYSRCDEFIGEPFQPFPGLLAHLVDELPADVLAAHAAQCGGDLSRLLPQIRPRTPAPHDDFGGDQAAARHLLFHAVVDIVRRSAEIDPVMLIVDDLHWAEPTGLQLLVHLVRELADLPVMVVANYRDTGEANSDQLRVSIGDLLRLGANRISLSGLDEQELADLVRVHVTGSDGRDVGGIALRLATETAGNPLFAEHLLQHWVELKLLTVAQDVITLTPSNASEPSATLRDLVWRRMSMLGQEGKEVLGAAAVLGVEFEESIVSSMTGIDRVALDRWFDRALEAGLVAPGGHGSPTTRFTHAVVARSLSAELGERTRARLHGAAFDALLAAGMQAGSEVPPVLSVLTARLAHHAEQAARLADAQQWATAAGDGAMANLAAEEAVRWFRRALDHATSRKRPDRERADLLVRLAEAEYRAGQPGGLDALHDAASLAERCGADDVLIRAALAIDPGSIVRFGRFAPLQLAIAESAIMRVGGHDLATKARVEALLAHSLVHTDQTARRTEAATAALAFARESGDAGTVARVAPNVLMALWAPGTAQLRNSIADEATAIVQKLGDPSLSSTVYAAAHTAAVCAGDAPAAARYSAQLRAIADETGEPRALWAATIVDGFTAMMTCRFSDAQTYINEALDLGLRIGEPETWTIFTGQSFMLGTFQGRHSELFPLVQQVIDKQESVDLSIRIAHAIVSVEVGERAAPTALLHEAMFVGLDAVPRDFIRSTILLGYAVLALELEDVDAAAALLPEVIGLASEVSFNGVTSQGPTATYAGKLLSLLGRHDQAEGHLLDGLATTEEFGWEYHRASTLLALAQNRARAGIFDAAADRWLTEASGLCDAYGLSVWARRVAALREDHPHDEVRRK